MTDAVQPPPRYYVMPPHDVPASVPVPYRGTILVRTESSTSYVIDVDRGLLTRTRGTETSTDPEVAAPSTLRRDGETLRLLRFVAPLEVGGRMVVDVESLGGPLVAFTRRRSTPVVGIHPMPEGGVPPAE